MVEDWVTQATLLKHNGRVHERRFPSKIPGCARTEPFVVRKDWLHHRKAITSKLETSQAMGVRGEQRPNFFVGVQRREKRTNFDLNDDPLQAIVCLVVQGDELARPLRCDPAGGCAHDFE